MISESSYNDPAILGAYGTSGKHQHTIAQTRPLWGNGVGLIIQLISFLEM